MKCCNISCEMELEEYRVKKIKAVPNHKVRFCAICIRNSSKRIAWSCLGCGARMLSEVYHLRRLYCSGECRSKNASYYQFEVRSKMPSYQKHLKVMHCSICSIIIEHKMGGFRGKICTPCRVRLTDKIRNRKCELCKNTLSTRRLFYCCIKCNTTAKYWEHIGKREAPDRHCAICEKHTKKLYCSVKCRLTAHIIIFGK